MDISAVRQAIADAVKNAIPGLNTYAYVPDSTSVPCFYVGGVEVRYDQTLGDNNCELSIVCPILISNTNDRSGQMQLDTFLMPAGDQSLKAAIESDPSLGDLCSFVEVVSAQNYGYNNSRLGADLIINVVGNGV
ncbi:hypothetical protein O7630_06710 [Micromonospora sp. WMMD718]|uniref:hypothetical protein n=1 Tax=unclassified Micromonospora TaxID=2617518 RepID=UPI00128BABEE|nr:MULTISPECIES: hypothetical protein [unclassified Micromonospora]MDG4750622.1 hypothetical protein [Micromonospora sp. WMMD718]